MGSTLTAVSQVMEGISGYQQGQYQAAVAKNNSIIAKYNARTATDAGIRKEQAQRLGTNRLLGAEKVASAAGNIDVNVGSAVDIRANTAAMGELDAATIRANAAREALGYKYQASSLLAQAKMGKKAATGALVQGFLGAGSTLLGGSSGTVDSKWLSTADAVGL